MSHAVPRDGLVDQRNLLVDRHDHHGEGAHSSVHNPVTSFHVSGPVRFPLSPRLYRRYAELTPWEAAVAKHIPAQPNDRARHGRCRTKIALAVEPVEEVIRCKVPFGVVVFDAWELEEDLVGGLARRRKDWISLLKKNRLLETASVHLRDANGWPLKLPVPQSAVEPFVPLIPANTYRLIKVGEPTHWYLTLEVRLPGLARRSIGNSHDVVPPTHLIFAHLWA